MIVVMKNGAPEAQVHDVSARLEELGYVVNPMFGVEKTVIGAVGGDERDKIDA